MLVLVFPRVSSRVTGFPVASPCLWGKLENISFSKVSKQVVMSFCVAGVAPCDIPTCLIMCRKCQIGGSFAQNARFSASTCLVSSLWFSCGVALSMGEAPHSTLYTLHSTLYTLHSTLHTNHSTVHTLHFTLYTPHFTLYTLHTPHSTLYTPHFTLRTPHTTLYTLHSTLYTLHSTLYTLHSTLTSSTAQGGGGSFKNRKPIGEIGCCESGMAERIHWWTERCLRSPLFLSLSLTIYLPTSLSSMHLSIYRSIYLSLSLFHLITYLPIYLSTYLPMYLSTYLSIYLSYNQGWPI